MNKILKNIMLLTSLVVLVAFLSGCAQQIQGDGGVKVSECRYPIHKLQVSVSPTRCQQLHDDCDSFDVSISSPQISSLAASGKYPCTVGWGPVGSCAVLEVQGWSDLFCGDISECTKGLITDVSTSFGGAMVTYPSIKITDTVTYCPISSDGKPLGNCVSSLTKQCDPDATLNLLIN